MHLQRGSTSRTETLAACDELVATWPPEFAPDLLLLLCSTAQDAPAVAAEIQRRFPHAQMVGCTTTGEHLDGEHFRGATVLMGIQAEDVRFHVEKVTGLQRFGADEAQAVAGRLFDKAGVHTEDLDPEKFFCMNFIDGLSLCEEHVVAELAEALGGVPMIGGSAGDDLAFQQTQVICNGSSAPDTAVFVLVQTERRFKIFKHQHFIATPRSLVITKADTAARRVYEIDGYTALEAYAAALGLTPAQVTGEVCFANPVTFRCDGELYVRSIQAVDPDDGSIAFYCALEEGMVLEIGGHEPMTDALAAQLDAVSEELGGIDLMIGWNCILRALESDGASAHATQGALFERHTAGFIAFDTYGEQLNGLHINQTLLGVAFQAAA